MDLPNKELWETAKSTFVELYVTMMMECATIDLIELGYKYDEVKQAIIETARRLEQCTKALENV